MRSTATRGTRAYRLTPPWTQWGWGFCDGNAANAAIDHILGIEEAAPKPDATHAYMEALYAARETVYGSLDP